MDYTPEQLDKLARAINEKRGYSVTSSRDANDQTLLQLHKGHIPCDTPVISGQHNVWASAPRVCTDREAAKVTLEEFVEKFDKFWVVTKNKNGYFCDIYWRKDPPIRSGNPVDSEALAISLCLASAMGINVEEVIA